jgi:hypothetical protein
VSRNGWARHSGAKCAIWSAMNQWTSEKC